METFKVAHIAGEGGGPPSDELPAEPLGPDTLPTSDRPDGLVRIAAALVNDTRSPEQETVTLLDTSPREVFLAGWHLADKQKNKMALSGALIAGASLVVRVAAPMVLSNKGGIITLLDDRGLKVDGVSYTGAHARHPGWTITF